MEEGVVIKPAEAGGKSKLWVLITILIVFIITIVGLVVWIGHNNSGNSEQKEASCEEKTDEYEVISCLSREEPGEELNQRYDAIVEKAFEEENYEFFEAVIFDRTTGLVAGGDCKASFNWLDTLEKKYVAELSILDQYGFYVSGVNTALECDDSEKNTYYQEKINAILSSKEYSEAISNNDYRVYGVDIPEEGQGDFEEEESEDEE